MSANSRIRTFEFELMADNGALPSLRGFKLGSPALRLRLAPRHVDLFPSVSHCDLLSEKWYVRVLLQEYFAELIRDYTDYRKKSKLPEL